MNRSWPPNLPVVEKGCATRFLLNSFISATLSELSFLQTQMKRRRKKKVCEEIYLREAFWKVYFQSEAGESVAVPRLSLLSFFQQTLLDSAACTSGGTARIAREIDVTLCTSEWQQGCLSCSSSSGYWHLSPSVLHLPSPCLCPHNKQPHTLAHIRTPFSELRVPTSKASLPLISLITQTVRSTPPSSTVPGIEKNETGEKGKGRQRGRFIHLGGLICSERCCFGSKNFPLTRVQLILWNGCPLSRSDGTIPLVCRLGDESVMLRKRERWKCCRRLKTPDITCSRCQGCFIDFYPLPPHHRHCRPRCQPHRRHHCRYLHECHSSSPSLSSSSSSLLISVCSELTCKCCNYHHTVRIIYNYYGQMKNKTHKSKTEKRDADVSIQGSRALWMFDEYENDVNHMLWPLQSPDLKPSRTAVGDFGALSWAAPCTIIMFQDIHKSPACSQCSSIQHNKHSSD